MELGAYGRILLPVRGLYVRYARRGRRGHVHDHASQRSCRLAPDAAVDRYLFRRCDIRLLVRIYLYVGAGLGGARAGHPHVRSRLLGAVFPYDIKVFSLAYSFVGIFLAFYVMFIALEIERKRAGNWIATLVLAAVIWVVSFFNMMNFAGEGGSVALTCLQFFLAGWGFVYGALALNGVEPVKGSCPFRCGSKASDAA